MVNKKELYDELTKRYRLAIQAEYCSSAHVPDYWIIDVETDTVVESGGDWNPERDYENFIESKMKEELGEYCFDEVDE